MHIERTHKMIECLTEKALAELDKGIENVNTQEMGEVVDMIKDLNEAEYRAVIVKAMKEADEEEKEYDKELLKALKMEYGEEGGKRFYDDYRYMRTGRYAPKGKGTYSGGRRGYDEPPFYHMTPDMYKMHDAEWYRDMDRADGKLYYTEPAKMASGTMDNMRRTGTGMDSRYENAKRGYEESKQMHKANTAEDKQAKMKDLEKYAKELTSDVVDMVADMSDEEKNLLRAKMQTLIQKIQ